MTDKIKKSDQANFTVGVVMSRMRNEWNRSLAQGIKDVAFENGINIIQYCIGSLNVKNRESLQCNIISELIDTDKLNVLIISSSAFATDMDEKECEIFCQRFTSIPVIMLNKESKAFYTISHDVYQSVVIAVRHLVDVHQYYNIVFMKKSNARNYPIQIKAFRNTLNSLNIPVNNKFIVNDIPDDDKKDDLLAILLKLIENGAEVIITGEAVAKNVVYVLTKAGIKIPGELAVFGINNLISSQFTVPPLSTIEHSFYQQGRIVMEKVVGLKNGKPLGKNIKLEPVLIRRSSCGCFNQPVHEITESISRENLTIREGDFLDNKEKLLSELNKLVGNTVEDQELINELLNAYDAELKKPGEYIFLNFLNNFFKTKIYYYNNPNILQKILSLLINWSIPYLKNRENFFKIQFTWQQARLFIDDFIMHNQALSIFHTRKQYEDYRLFSRGLLSTLDLKKLLNILFKELSRNNIPYAYLVIYEKPGAYKYPDPIAKWSRLIMAYSEKERIDMDESGIRFRTKNILPEKIWQEYFTFMKNNYYCIIESLSFEGKQMGYMVFGVSGKPSDFTYWLKNIISISLHGALDLQLQS